MLEKPSRDTTVPYSWNAHSMVRRSTITCAAIQRKTANKITNCIGTELIV